MMINIKIFLTKIKFTDSKKFFKNIFTKMNFVKTSDNYIGYLILDNINKFYIYIIYMYLHTIPYKNLSGLHDFSMQRESVL